VNTNLFSPTSAISNPYDINGILEDININAPRGRTIIASTNFLRNLSMLSKVSSMEYHNHIEAQNNKPNWANQTEAENFHISYATSERGKSSIQVLADNNSYGLTTCVDHTNTTFPNLTQSSFNMSFLSYEEIQPDNLNSWEGHTQPISIFGKHSTQDININNIKISLSRILDFITNYHIKNNKKGDILCLEGFGQVAFEFIIYILK